MNLAEKFWSNVEVIPFHECWEWVGGRDGRGYGLISHGKNKIKAHRFSYEIVNGKIPSVESYHGNCVRHTCDNRGCVNPKHLILGTQAENMNDMKKRGRERHPGQFGEKNGMSKITKEIVLEIRSLYASKEFSQSEIGNKFGLSQSHVGCIVRGKKWGVL